MKVFMAVDVIRYEEKLLINAFKDFGVDVTLVKVDDELLPLGNGNVLGGDVALIRTLSAFNGIYSAVAFESMGALTINSSKALYLCNDKILTYGLLIKEGVRVPKTYVALSSHALQRFSSRLSYPVVDKPPIGSWGRLVSLIRDPTDLKMIAEHREYLPSPQLKAHIVQEAVGLGKDVRCIVIGDEVLGCMMRVAGDGEWRSNVALGGSVRRFDDDSELREMVLRAARAVGAEVAGVDVLINDTYYVNEINGIPEFKGFINATGIKVYEHIAKHVINAVRR